MTEGIRATLEFTEDDICPITMLSSKASTKASSVSTNVCTDSCSSCVTDFVVHGEHPSDVDMQPIYSSGSLHRYRLTREGDADCPCEVLGEHGCSVDRYVADDGVLTISFYAEGYDELREAVAELRRRYPDVDVRRLIRSPADDIEADPVFVDRGKLTTRQHEVLEKAYVMGYFDRPRRSNVTEIAEELDVEPSTVSEHLAAAQSKILEDVFLD